MRHGSRDRTLQASDGQVWSRSIQDSDRRSMTGRNTYVVVSVES
jgi:hypothetical protein